MRIMLTNDDGYDAPGLRAAYVALRDCGTVQVVAPREERSSCSHAITTGRPINVERLSMEPFGTVYAVDGTPADCVRLAHAGLIDGPMDLVVSGVNRGANAGVDIYYSGTIAAAREAALLGMASIAVSQATRAGVEIDWPAVSAITATLVKELVQEKLPRPGFWSINYPAPMPDDPEKHVERVGVAEQSWPIRFERGPVPDGAAIQFQYAAPYWEREVTQHSDYTVIRDGGIAVSAIPLFCRF